MPSPNKNETKKDFLKRCIPQVIKEGKKQDQAIAICNSLFENKKKTKKAKTTKKPFYEDDFCIAD